MRLVLFVELMLAIYLGVNWGVGNFDSPGGQVVMSIVASAFLEVLFFWVTVFVARLFRRRPDYSYLVNSRSSRPMTPADQEARRAAAVASFREESERKKRAFEQGQSPAEFAAETAAEERQHKAQEDEDFAERIRRARPLSPPAE